MKPRRRKRSRAVKRRRRTLPKRHRAAVPSNGAGRRLPHIVSNAQRGRSEVRRVTRATSTGRPAACATKVMAPVNANRRHGDEDIRVSLTAAFTKYEIESFCLETLTCGRIARPPNVHTVKRLVESIADRRSMNKHEPVIAWDVAEGRRPVLWGTQRVHAAIEYASRGNEPTFEVYVVLMKGLETPAPSKGDLEFAALEAMRFESVAAP